MSYRLIIPQREKGVSSENQDTPTKGKQQAPTQPPSQESLEPQT
jgi:hypothetical protein